MQKKFILKFKNALNKVLKHKKCSLHEPIFDKIESNYLLNVLKKRSVSTYGKETTIFENKLKNFTKSKYAFCVINGTSGLHLSLFSLGVDNNCEVLIPALNYIASANAVIYCGGTPHFIDVEEKTLGPDAEKLDKYLKKISKLKNGILFNKRTGRTIKYIIITHIFGHAVDIGKIFKVCKKYRLKIIEDAAEGLGSYYKNKHLGTFGETGVISFNGNKIITSGGGGVILTNSKKISEKIRMMYTNSRKNHVWEYKFYDLGFNYKMPSLNAQLGIAQLKKLKKFLKLKRSLYKKYYRVFKNFSEFYLLKEPKFCKSNYWLQTIILKKSDPKLIKNILSETNKAGYGTRPVWSILNTNSHLRKYPSMNLNCARSLEKRIINLPSSPFHAK